MKKSNIQEWVIKLKNNNRIVVLGGNSFVASNLIKLLKKDKRKFLLIFKKNIEDSNSLYETMLDKTTQSLEKIISNTESLSKIQ